MTREELLLFRASAHWYRSQTWISSGDGEWHEQMSWHCLLLWAAWGDV